MGLAVTEQEWCSPVVALFGGIGRQNPEGKLGIKRHAVRMPVNQFDEIVSWVNHENRITTPNSYHGMFTGCRRNFSAARFTGAAPPNQVLRPTWDWHGRRT